MNRNGCIEKGGKAPGGPPVPPPRAQAAPPEPPPDPRADPRGRKIIDTEGHGGLGAPGKRPLREVEVAPGINEMVPTDIDPDDYRAEWLRRHDTDTQTHALLIQRIALPRLLKAGWVLRQRGADGLGLLDQPKRGLRIMHSVAREDDGEVWSHVSLSRRDRVFPTWEQLRDAFWLIQPDAYGVVVIAPPDNHVNKAEVAHVWAKLTGGTTVPDFTFAGHI